MKFFTAPAFVRGLSEFYSSTAEKSHFNSLHTIYNNFTWNIGEFVCNPKPSVIALLILFCFAFYSLLSSKKHCKNDKSWGLLFMFVMIIFTFLLLYNCMSFFIEKQLMFFIPLFIYIIIINKKNSLLVLFFSIILFTPYSLYKVRENINQRNQAYISFVKNKEIIKCFSFMFNNCHCNKGEINVLYSSNEFNSIMLPQSVHGIPILYTTNVLGKNDPDSLKYSLYHKIKVDYILSNGEIQKKGFRLCKKTMEYSLYENIQ
jgi:hypothetical protein